MGSLNQYLHITTATINMSETKQELRDRIEELEKEIIGMKEAMEDALSYSKDAKSSADDSISTLSNFV